MPALHHALLGASIVALALAGLRLASLIAERGLPRVLAAATFATAAAAAEALLLGLIGLGGSTAALVLAAIAAAAAAYALLPAPTARFSEELAGAWASRSSPDRALLGAIAGGGLAWAVWQLRHPALGFDTVHYHLPEMVIFVQGGHPGSIHDVLPGLPVGNYPLTTEVTIAWGMAIARSFVPLVLWSWVTLSLTAAAAWAGLRALGVPRIGAGLAAAALCTNPWLLAWQSNGSVTDPPSLAWLVVCASLVVLSRANRALLVPAIVAGGLAIGGKTTVLPYTLVVLAFGLWDAYRARALRVRPLGIATVVAIGVGGIWYLRNLFEHGSPFWPLVATPWGDPLPRSVELVKTSFLDNPSGTIDVLQHAYLNRFGGGLIVVAGALLTPLVAPRRRVLVAMVATLAGLLLWMRSPVTGIKPGAALPETVFSTTRYALPVVACGCVALALAAADAGRRWLRLAPLAVLAAAAVLNLVLTIRLRYPIAPAALTPLAGAAIGALAAVALAARRPVAVALRAGAVIAVIACALLAIPANGFLKRHSDTSASAEAVIGQHLVADAAYRNGSNAVATTPAYIGALAGDELRHRLVAIGAGESCAQLMRRSGEQWLVIYGGPLGVPTPPRFRRCLPHPWEDLKGILLYRPRSAAG